MNFDEIVDKAFEQVEPVAVQAKDSVPGGE